MQDYILKMNSAVSIIHHNSCIVVNAIGQFISIDNVAISECLLFLLIDNIIGVIVAYGKHIGNNL